MAVSISTFDKAYDQLRYDHRDDALMYMGARVPRHIEAEAQKMAKRGAPRLVIEEYVIQMMQIEREKNRIDSDHAMRTLLRDYPDLARRVPAPGATQQPTYPKELLCLL